jgi:O-antigen ligase
MFYLFLILIFICPFISSLVSPYPSFVHSALLLAVLIAWIIAGKLSLNKLRPLKYPLILFGISLISSTVFSQNKIISVGESYKYFIPILMLWAISNLDQKKKQIIVEGLVWAGFIVSLIAFYQYFFGFDNTLKFMAEARINDPEAMAMLQRKRVFLPFVTPDVLAGYLIMVFLLAVSRKKVFIAVPVILVLLLTRSLGALISLLLVSAFYAYAKGKLNRKAVFWLAALLLAIITVLISRSIGSDGQMHPMFSLIARLNYWRDTLVMIKGHLLTGVGMGNFNLCNCRYTHNTYLQLWAETGILGMGSFLWLIVRILGNNKRVSLLLMAALVFLVHNFFEFTFFLPETVFIWWTIAGLVLYENEEPITAGPGRA